MAVDIVQDVRIGPTRYVELYFSAATTGEEGAITGLGRQVTVTRIVTAQISGTAATTNPAIGRVPGFSLGDFDELGSGIDGAPAARVGTVAPLEVDLGEGGTLYLQPRPNAGADNVIRAELHIQDGWGWRR